LRWRGDWGGFSHAFGRCLGENWPPARHSGQSRSDGAAGGLAGAAIPDRPGAGPSRRSTVGHIFNLGHGLHQTTPVEKVKRLVDYVHENTGNNHEGGDGVKYPLGVLLMAYGGPNSLDEIPGYLADIRSGRPTPARVVEEIEIITARSAVSPPCWRSPAARWQPSRRIGP
jgi:hypothetical protein